jgi:hypothetical protein
MRYGKLAVRGEQTCPAKEEADFAKRCTVLCANCESRKRGHSYEERNALGTIPMRHISVYSSMLKVTQITPPLLGRLTQR